MNDEVKGSADSEYDDLEAPSSEITEIEVRGKKARYKLMDISSAAMQEAINRMNVPDKAKAAEAKRLFQAKMISIGARRVAPKNGKDERISIDEAKEFGSALASALTKAVMKFNGADPDEKEADVKND